MKEQIASSEHYLPSKYKKIRKYEKNNQKIFIHPFQQVVSLNYITLDQVAKNK